MRIRYQIFEEKGILIQSYLDEFSYDHYISFMDMLLKTPGWKIVKKVLTDARHVNPEDALVNLQKLIKYRKEVIKRDYLNVFLVTEPLSTAITHLYQGALTRIAFEYHYCSTIEKANEYLNLGISAEKLSGMLENLVDQY